MTNPITRLVAEHPEVTRRILHSLDGLIRAGQLYGAANRSRFRASCRERDHGWIESMFSRLKREYAIGLELLGSGLEPSSYKSAREVYNEVLDGRRPATDLPDFVMVAAADLQDQLAGEYLRLSAEFPSSGARPHSTITRTNAMASRNR